MSGDLEEGKTMEEFTTVVRLLHTELRYTWNKHKFLQLKVADHKTKALLEIDYDDRSEYEELTIGSTLFIKGGSYKSAKENIVVFRDLSNLMVVPNNSLLKKKLYERINFYCDPTGINSFEKSYTISKVLNDSIPIVSFSHALSDTMLDSRYRLRVFVLEVGPENIYDWVKGYCSQCDKSFPLTKEDREIIPVCIYCNNNGKAIFQVQLFVQDKNKEERYRLLVYTHNDKGKEFFDEEKARNLYKDKKLYTKLKGLKKLTKKYGVYLDCVVERMKNSMNTYFQIVDTIIGDNYVKEIIESNA